MDDEVVDRNRELHRIPLGVPLDEADSFAADRAVIDAASAGPWSAEFVDDHFSMNCITIRTAGGTGELDDFENNVAIVLLQEPRLACVSDSKWDENAMFIARSRHRWPAAIERVRELEAEVARLKTELQKARTVDGR